MLYLNDITSLAIQRGISINTISKKVLKLHFANKCNHFIATSRILYNYYWWLIDYLSLQPDTVMAVCSEWGQLMQFWLTGFVDETTHPWWNI